MHLAIHIAITDLIVSDRIAIRFLSFLSRDDADTYYSTV